VDSPLEGDGFELLVRERGASGCRAFDAPGCLGRVGSRRSDPATTIAERVAFGRVPDKIGRQKGRADPSKAGKRDNQMHRARVLEVRIHLPPAESQQTFGSSQYRRLLIEAAWCYRFP
jgi:hypothetical protein